MLNSTNAVVGNAYERLNVLKRYLNLGQVNDSLALENAKLKTELINSANVDSTKTRKINDSVYKQQYTLLSAKVIKNSINQRNNFITINKGSKDGVTRDMAVISPQNGVIGFVLDVSTNFSTIRSLLNKETLISVIIKKNGAFGSLVWGDGNFNLKKAYVKEIPKGIVVGRVSKTQIATGDNFMTLEIDLFNDFGTLQYVYIIKDRLAIEQKILEDKLPNEQ